LVEYGAAPKTLPVTADLGGASRFLAHDQNGTLAAGATDRYTFALRPDEPQSTAGGTVLLGVEVDAAAGSALRPAVPVVTGLTPLAQHTVGGSAFALFAIDNDRIQVLQVAGASGTTAGAYTLHLFVGGDVDGNGTVDVNDGALVTAALGTHAGQPGYTAAADV